MTAPRPINDGVPGLGLGGDPFADARRQQDMTLAWRAYLGQLPDALTIQPGEPNVNVKTNRAAPVVDTGLFYLFGLELEIEVDPATPKADAAQKALDGCWGDLDDRMTLLAKLAMNGAIFGQPFAKILPPDPDAGRDYARLVVQNPENITVQTDPDDCDSVISYTICYDAPLPDGSTVTKRQVIARRDVYDLQARLEQSSSGSGTATPADSDADGALDDETGEIGTSELGDAPWVIATYARRGVGGDWLPLGPAEAWPHPWPPMVDCQNLPVSNQHWGLPDLTPDLIQLNKVLNFVLSNINSIGLSHGHPWVWADADMSQVTIAPGNILSLPQGAQLQALIAEGNIAGLMQFAADLRSSMDEQSKVPGVATGRIAELPKGQMSGVSLRMLYQPLLFKTIFKRRLYGKLIREACTRMLALMGFGDGTDAGGVKVILHWKDPMPTDDLQEAQTAQAWQAIGVSASTLMSRGGFDPEVEAQKKAEEDAAQLANFAQGKGMPPGVPTDAPDEAVPPSPPGAAPNATEDDEQEDAPNTPPPVNHPAAVLARAKMQAAFGKSGKGSN